MEGQRVAVSMCSLLGSGGKEALSDDLGQDLAWYWPLLSISMVIMAGGCVWHFSGGKYVNLGAFIIIVASLNVTFWSL